MLCFRLQKYSFLADYARKMRKKQIFFTFQTSLFTFLFGFLLTYSYLCTRFKKKAHRVMVN